MSSPFLQPKFANNAFARNPQLLLLACRFKPQIYDMHALDSSFHCGKVDFISRKSAGDFRLFVVKKGKKSLRF